MVYLYVRISFPLSYVCVCFFKKKKKKPVLCHDDLGSLDSKSFFDLVNSCLRSYSTLWSDGNLLNWLAWFLFGIECLLQLPYPFPIGCPLTFVTFIYAIFYNRTKWMYLAILIRNSNRYLTCMYTTKMVNSGHKFSQHYFTHCLDSYPFNRWLIQLHNFY